MAEELKTGDWVVHNVTGNIGYVEEVLNYFISVNFFMHRGRVMMKSPFVDHLSPLKINLMPPEPRIYHQDEMDVALSTKDMEWCRELQKLKGEKIDG